MTQFRQWWDGIPSAQRRGLAAVAVVDLGLRVWTLVDLARRPAAEVRGPKAAWAVGLATVSSAGLLPLTYLAAGRRRS